MDGDPSGQRVIGEWMVTQVDNMWWDVVMATQGGNMWWEVVSRANMSRGQGVSRGLCVHWWCEPRQGGPCS